MMSTLQPDETILIVEDDEETSRSFADILGVMGYRAETAANGKVALEILRRAPQRYCVILLDIMMPVMDGWEFLKEFKADAAISKIPVIIVSAVTNGERDNARVAAVEFLPKPVDTSQLLSSLQRHC